MNYVLQNFLFEGWKIYVIDVDVNISFKHEENNFEVNLLEEMLSQ